MLLVETTYLSSPFISVSTGGKRILLSVLVFCPLLGTMGSRVTEVVAQELGITRFNEYPPNVSMFGVTTVEIEVRH